MQSNVQTIWSRSKSQSRPARVAATPSAYKRVISTRQNHWSFSDCPERSWCATANRISAWNGDRITLRKRVGLQTTVVGVGLRWWPLFDLRIRTPRLELRLPTDEDLDELADLAAAGIHDPDAMPFSHPWTDQEQPALQRGLLQWGWRMRAELSPDNWHLGFCVREDDVIVGVQDVFAEKFSIRRAVRTGSWLGTAYQGRGIGKEMRAAVLHLAFDSLGAERAETEAFEDNPSSLGVTRALGYEPNGDGVFERRGQPARIEHFVMTREKWEQHRRDDITVDGVEECLPLFGLGSV